MTEDQVTEQVAIMQMVANGLMSRRTAVEKFATMGVINDAVEEWRRLEEERLSAS